MRSELHAIAATPTTEAEYDALSDLAKLIIGLRYLFHGPGAPQPGPTVIYQDITATIASETNSVHRSRLRHEKFRVYRIREFVKAQEVLTLVCSPTTRHAEMCTKALPAPLLRAEVRRSFITTTYSTHGNRKATEQLFTPLLAGPP